MGIAQTLIPELEQEAAATRRVLERVPEEKLGWRPHTKSMTLGDLAWHVASTQGLVAGMLEQDTVDFGSLDSPSAPDTTAGILAGFTKSIAEAKAFLEGLDDQHATAVWRLTSGNRELMALPRIAFIRTVMMNHTYHHRGQLAVYLRLLEVPVPAIYGVSADENPFA